ncbi:MAG: methylated-DNA--[protein]-cysteine S-methyltransferase [Clostridia bacterium]|nr:methylated-DNA--[protein]-cysteine S-methyltransferase [Clostridia bacterium]
MMNTMIFESPVGIMTLTGTDSALTGLSFGAEQNGDSGAPSPLLERAADQLKEYFAGKREAFDLPLAPEGTEFMKKVWAALCNIPFGETRTYGQIAAAVGNPKAARAVGMACNLNPIGIIVPCHRVIGANGSLTGYAGGLPMKAALLQLEAGKRQA